MLFAWDEWNRCHVAKHGVTVEEAEHVVATSRRPYPLAIDAEKRLVVGRTARGRLIHVIFVLRNLEDLDLSEQSTLSLGSWLDSGEELAVYVIHAMPASLRQRRHHRRRRKS